MELGERIAEIAVRFAKARVPYRHRGTSKTGVDCTGLIIAVMREAGYMGGYRLREYGVDWNLHDTATEQILEELCRMGAETKKHETRPGDIVLFRFARAISHAGIYVSKPGLFVHAYKAAGRCRFGSLVKSNWGRRWVVSWRLEAAMVEQLCG